MFSFGVEGTVDDPLQVNPCETLGVMMLVFFLMTAIPPETFVCLIL